MKTLIKIIFTASIVLVLSCQKEAVGLNDNSIAPIEKNAALSLTLPQSNIVLTAKKAFGKRAPAKRYGHSSVVFDNRMWILGGKDDGILKNDVLSSSTGNSWELKTPNAQFSPRFNHASAVFQNKIWVIGGSTYDKDGDRYDLNDVWSSNNGIDWEVETLHANFPTRGGHSLTVFQGALWLIGGLGVDQPQEICCGYSDIWRSTDGIHWTLIDASASFDRRVGHAAVVFDNKLWVSGGDHAGGNDEIWFSSNGINWSKIAPNPVFPRRRNHTLITDGERLWLIAGWKIVGQSNLDNTIWYSTDGVDWLAAQTTQFLPKRHDHTSLFYNNKLWVLQGYGYANSRTRGYAALPDIWSFVIPNSFHPITDFNSK